MFKSREEEIKDIIGEELVAINDEPEVVFYNDFLSPLDINYLLKLVPALTETISGDDVDRYIVSPYANDFIKLICHKVSSIVGMSMEHLYYTEVIKQNPNNQLVMTGFSSPQIQESPVATSPHGPIHAMGVIALTDTQLTQVGVPIPATKGTISLAKTVDVDAEMCNNSILTSSASDEDAWIWIFKFHEEPRELNEIEL